MLLLRLGALSLVFTATRALGGEPCEPPPIRDVAPLLRAVRADRDLAQAFSATAEACRLESDACESARAACSQLLDATLRAQAALDDGWWLRDVLLPYLGQVYPSGRALTPPEASPPVSCGGDSAALAAAAAWRGQQGERRQALLNEYPLYARWASEAHARCRKSLAAQEAKASAERAEAAKVAAAAAAAKALDEQRRAAEEQRRVAQEATRVKAEEDARRVREAKEMQEAQAKKQRQSVEEARKQAEEDGKRGAEAEERARRTQEEKAREAQAQARAAEEQRQVSEREQRKVAVRQQQDALVAEAEGAARLEARAAEERSKRAAQEAEEAADAAKEVARRRVEEARAKARALGVPDEDERNRGALAILVGAGYSAQRSTEGKFQGVLIGAQVVGHLGFWAVAPASGMASGFELRALVGFSQAMSGGTQRELSGNLSARYYLGWLGLGLGAELRNLAAVVGDASRASNLFGVGPALGVQFVDTPRRRISLNAMWLPLGGAIDEARAFGDLEFSQGVFALHLVGGLISDPTAPVRRGWLALAVVGVRVGR